MDVPSLPPIDPIGPGDRPAEDLTARARVRDAAMVEFAERGYRGATLRGIAAAAGVSLGVVQHHFGTKAGLQAACDEVVFDLIRLKTSAVEDGNLGDPQVQASLMSMAPVVQRYVGRAMVDGSARMAELVDRLMDNGEAFLTARWPDRYAPGTGRTRDAAAVMIALNTSTMVLQDHLARRMGIEPYCETTIRRIGAATLDAYETISDMVASEMWRDLRAGMDASRDEGGTR